MGGSVAVIVPRVPLTESVTVMVLLTVVVGAPNWTATVLVAVPSGVWAALPSHLSYAVSA